MNKELKPHKFDRLFAIAEWIRGQADATQSNLLYSDHLLVHEAQKRISELEAKQGVTDEQFERFVAAYGKAETAELSWRECVKRGFQAALHSDEDKKQ